MNSHYSDTTHPFIERGNAILLVVRFCISVFSFPCEKFTFCALFSVQERRRRLLSLSVFLSARKRHIGLALGVRVCNGGLALSPFPVLVCRSMKLLACHCRRYCNQPTGPCYVGSGPARGRDREVSLLESAGFLVCFPRRKHYIRTASRPRLIVFCAVAKRISGYPSAPMLRREEVIDRSV